MYNQINTERIIMRILTAEEMVNKVKLDSKNNKTDPGIEVNNMFACYYRNIKFCLENNNMYEAIEAFHELQKFLLGKQYGNICYLLENNFERFQKLSSKFKTKDLAL